MLFLIDLIDELAGESVGAVAAVTVFGDHTVVTFKKVCCYISGLSRDSVERVINLCLELPIFNFPREFVESKAERLNSVRLRLRFGTRGAKRLHIGSVLSLGVLRRNQWHSPKGLRLYCWS